MLPLLASKIISGIPLDHLAIALSLFIFLHVLAALFDPKKFREALLEFFHAGNAIIRMMAVFNLLVAFLILNTYWKINFNSVKTIMSVFGYLLLVRGIIAFWFPSFVRERVQRMLSKDTAFYTMMFIGLFAAMGFGYLGFWVY